MIFLVFGLSFSWAWDLEFQNPSHNLKRGSFPGVP